MTNRREIDIIKGGYCDIRDEFFNFYNEYIKKYPERINAKDPRVSILANPIQLITVQRTNFELLDKSILREEFWKLNSDKVLDTKFNVEHHQLFFKFSFFLLIIAHFESNLRSIESLVKHSENSQSDRPINKIYKSIISALKISAIDKQNIFTFLDLMFTLRNAIHNNAIFFPYDKKDKIIDYKGRKYEFKIGENIMHYSYHETLFFLQELFEVIKLILSDEKINTATFSNKS